MAWRGVDGGAGAAGAARAGGFIYPALAAMMSRAAPEDAQGELQGGIASLQSIGIADRHRAVHPGVWLVHGAQSADRLAVGAFFLSGVILR